MRGGASGLRGLVHTDEAGAWAVECELFVEARFGGVGEEADPGFARSGALKVAVGAFHEAVADAAFAVRLGHDEVLDVEEDRAVADDADAADDRAV